MRDPAWPQPGDPSATGPPDPAGEVPHDLPEVSWWTRIGQFLVISLLIHAAVVVGMLFKHFVLPVGPDDGADIGVVESGLVTDPLPPEPAVKTQTPAELPTPALEPPTDIPETADARRLLEQATADLAPEPPEALGAAPNGSTPLLGLGANGHLEGLTANLGGSPKAEFFGQRGRGRRIVWVVDRSGSMTDSFHVLQAELKRSISRLKVSQQFQLIFFNDGRPLEFTVDGQGPRLLPAIRAFKQKAYAFVDALNARGGTDPIPAMRRAMDYEPDLIFFLTDGEFSPALVDHLRKWNAGKRVKIFTIGYVYAAGADLLKQIAAENGGRYIFVDGRRYGF